MTTEPTPPIAATRETTRTHHGDTVVDEYAWLSDRDDPAVTDYLTAENAYTDARLAHLAGLRETVFAEIKARTLETDMSLPVRHHAWWYYTRTTEGAQYGVYCRLAAAPGDDTPPTVSPGVPLDGEQVLLDGNALAEGHDFFALGTFDVSPDGRWLAYSVDHVGDERYTLRIRDLTTGVDREDEITGVGDGSAWSYDASVLFYITVDDSWRPDKVWRHIVGTPTADDEVVFAEPDERFFVGVELSRSERFVIIGAGSITTTEFRFIPADAPMATPMLIAERRDGVHYTVDHHGHRFLILHNDGALDFELAYTPVDRPGEWATLIPHEPGSRLVSVDAFAGHLVVARRRDGLTALSVLTPDGSGGYDIAFPAPIYTVEPDSNPDYEATHYRLSYESFAEPPSIFDCEVATGALTLRKRRPVLADPSGREFDEADYQQAREWAIADDGTRVPISLVFRTGTPKDAPLVLYGYGAYESSIDPYFSVGTLSLLDRGVVFAVAHIRGGGEMGRAWYEDGKLLAKRNTFTDFIACARHLVATGWTSTDKLISRGGSAGGLLVGAAVTMAPDAFGGVVLAVPFVDAVTSMLDPSLPLTVTEREEWGDPLADPEVYRYMSSYSPYDNIRAVDYPPMLVMGSLNDTRVSFAEPAKFVARLRARVPKTDVVLKTEMGSGHAGPSGRYDSWREAALVAAWILDRFGVR